MSQEITKTTTVGTSLAEQIEFVRMVTSGEGQSILPDAYRGNPANALIAVGLGASMGLSPAESLYRISVIKGKPSASAELIASNIRKAGHKLRVVGNESSCTATVIRADDPDFPFEVTRDMAWAKGMGLASQDNYRKQPGTMLQWRAITAVARLACPEALYGVAYTPDELSDFGSGTRNSGPAAPPPAAARPVEAPNPTGRDWDGEVDDAKTADALRDLYREARSEGALTQALAARITEKGQALKAAEEEVVDAEIVDDLPADVPPTDPDADAAWLAGKSAA